MDTESVYWLGEVMRLHRPSHATVVAYLALFVAMSGTAVAATGNVFILGQDNRADHASVLANWSGTPLELRAKSGKAPLRVNTEKRVRHLNADLLDSKDSTTFMAALCPEGASIPFHAAVAAGCTQVTKVSGPMQVSPSWLPQVPGRLLLCPAGSQVVSGGYTLADDTVKVSESGPWGVRFTNAGWYIGLAPGASPTAIERSTAWALCLGPGTDNGRDLPPN
jgi:hypothetical protein